MRRRLLTGLLALVLGPAAAPSAAGAVYDPIASGTTRLTLDPSFLALLKREGVTLAARAPAELRGATIGFPVAGGKFDPTSSRGALEHEGALVFRAGARSIPLRGLRLKTTARRTPLAAKVGGSQLRLGTAGPLAVTREGFGEKVRVPKLSIGAKLATRLSKKLDLRGAFRAGQPLGSTSTTTWPGTVAVLPRGGLSLTFDPGFEAKLRSLFVAVNPIFPAERPASFTLPIRGGALAPDASQGTIETQGALEFLQLGGGQVLWRESRLDLSGRGLVPELEVQPSPPYGGKVGPLAVAALAPGPASSQPRARTVSLAAALVLDPVAAATFNEAFARPLGKDDVFAAGEALGSVSVTAQGQ